MTPIDGSGPSRRIVTDAFLFTHTANAFEDGEDIVVQRVVAEHGANADCLASARFGAEALAPSTPGRLTELRLNAGLRKVGVRSLAEPVIDFDGHFVSEALFVPRPRTIAEDASWLLCLNCDANADASYVTILNAEGVPELIATLRLGQPLPMNFHGLRVGRD